jgi:hypothetical protein
MVIKKISILIMNAKKWLESGSGSLDGCWLKDEILRTKVKN